jgi:hypothetical protein
VLPENGAKLQKYFGDTSLISIYCCANWWGDLRERNHLGDPGVDGRIILRWIFRKWDMGVGTESNWLRIGTGGGHL